MRAKGLIFVLLFVCLASSVLAYSDIDIIAVNNTIEFGEKAIYQVTINNQRDVTQTYSFFSTSAIGWNVQTSPVADNKLIIQPQQTNSLKIEVIPTERFDPGIYLVSLKISTDRGEEYAEALKVYMGPVLPKTYQPSLKLSADLNEKIDPTESQSIKVFVQNQNPLNIEDLTLRLQSDLPEFEKEQTFDLKSYESKTIEFAIQPNPFSQPKNYYLFLSLTKDNEVVKSLDKKIEIIPLTTAFAEQPAEIKSFLKSVKTITFTNPGNVRNQQTVKVKMGFFEDLFTSTEPSHYVLKDETGRYLAWDFELGVNDSTQVTLTTSYRLPVIILIILIVLTLVYFIYRSPVHLNKSASNVILHEGSVSGLKITLVVRNIGSKAIKDVEVFDTAPSIASVEKDVEMGTLKPTEILRDSRGGLLLKWKISELEGKEERLISYKIKSRLDIVGTITLPRAKAKFKTAKGKEHISYSNAYRVGGEAKE